MRVGAGTLVGTLELAENLGVRVDYPFDATCCGQPMANSGAHLAELVCDVWKVDEFPWAHFPHETSQREESHHEL